jgi:hypothetical protein
MSLPKLTTATVILSTLWFAAALSAQTAETPTTSDTVSKVRIVRLSEVKGEVQMDRANGRGMETAITNLPIVEHSKVSTAMGAAEVEFEDNSTLRVGPDSLVEFEKLERMANGATVSWVHVLKGTAYVSLMKSSVGNQFALMFGGQKLDLPPASHIRLETDTNEARLAVLDGTVQVPGESGLVPVSKKRTVTFTFTSSTEPSVANHVSTEPLDGWDKDAVGYHSRLAMVSSLNNSPYVYGMNDMMYYGNFVDAGGCGQMWRPYFAGAAWDPYSNGSWAWYGNSGYSWVSPYPWGWTPYHTGSWTMCPGMGWGWQPGGAWNGLNNTAMLPLQRSPRSITPVGPPALPSHPPRTGEATLIPVNQRPLVRSEVASPESFVFRRDSAGLGVPRETLGKLDKLSNEAMTHGTASTRIYVSAPTENRGMSGRAGAANPTMLGTNVHRGAAPSRGQEPSYTSIPSGGANASNTNSASRAATPMPSSGSHGPSSTSGRPK